MTVIRKPDIARTAGEDALGAFERLAVSDAAGLSRFGAFVEVLQPGARSSDRHWHTDEDEFLFLLTGEAVLVEEDGEAVMHPGDAACWKAGVENGHMIVNRSGAPCSFLIVGTRADSDRCHYSDIDKIQHREGGRVWLTRRDGTPLEES